MRLTGWNMSSMGSIESIKVKAGQVISSETGRKQNIKGNVIGGTGIQLRNQADITVTGDVTATLKEIDYTDVDYFNECGEWRMYCGNAIRAFIWDYDQSKNLKIKVKGNVIATGDGIIAEYGNFVIEGDVVSEFENGINVLEGFPVFIDVVGNVEGNVRRSAGFYHTQCRRSSRCERKN